MRKKTNESGGRKIQHLIDGRRPDRGTHRHDKIVDEMFVVALLFEILPERDIGFAFFEMSRRSFIETARLHEEAPVTRAEYIFALGEECAVSLPAVLQATVQVVHAERHVAFVGGDV